jgi:phage repressor protein C with HTH and peptisase S24 domain
MNDQDVRRAALQALIDKDWKGNVTAFATSIHKSPTQIADMLAGRKSFGERVARDIEKRGRLGHKSLDRLAFAPVAASENRNGYIRIPLLDVAVSAGQGVNVDGYESEVVEYLDIAEWWAQQNLPRNLSRVRVLTARGDSMAPDIQHGDVLFVDTAQRTYDAPGIYVLNWQGRALVKRLVPELRSEKLALHSTNQAYPTEYVSADEIDQLRISGRVAAWWTLKRY